MSIVDAGTLRTRGNAAFASGDFPAALQAYTQALHIAPATPELWSNRAACYMKLGQPYLAAADAYELLELRPDWPKSYFRLGKASFAMGGYGDALEWYDCRTLRGDLLTLVVSQSLDGVTKLDSLGC